MNINQVIKSSQSSLESEGNFVGVFTSHEEKHAGLAIYYEKKLYKMHYLRQFIELKEAKSTDFELTINKLSYIYPFEVENYLVRLQEIHDMYYRTVNENNYFYFNPPNYFSFTMTDDQGRYALVNGPFMCTCVGYSLLLLNSFIAYDGLYLDYDDWARANSQIQHKEFNEHQVEFFNCNPDLADLVKYAFRVSPEQLFGSAFIKKHGRKYKQVNKVVTDYKALLANG